MIGLQKWNCIMSKAESDHMKAWCIDNHVKWFRTEYWDDMYFEVTCTDDVLSDFRKELDMFAERTF